MVLQSVQDRQKAYADKARRDHEFKEGDYVLLSSKKFKTGIKKLHPKFLGPFPFFQDQGQSLCCKD
jgi:hypothetical protein